MSAYYVGQRVEAQLAWDDAWAPGTVVQVNTCHDGALDPYLEVDVSFDHPYGTHRYAGPQVRLMLRPLPRPAAVTTVTTMITPQKAREKRSVRQSEKYQQCVREVDQLLCGPPNDGDAWSYAVPPLRDGGALRNALREDYEAAGWRLSESGTVIRFREPGDTEMLK